MWHFYLYKYKLFLILIALTPPEEWEMKTRVTTELSIIICKYCSVAIIIIIIGASALRAWNVLRFRIRINLHTVSKFMQKGIKWGIINVLSLATLCKILVLISIFYFALHLHLQMKSMYFNYILIVFTFCLTI
jgi:hypothetical protein